MQPFHARKCQMRCQRDTSISTFTEVSCEEQKAGGEEAAPFDNVTEALAAAVRDLPPAAKPAAGKRPERHHPALLAALATELRCSPSEIVDLELNVCDTQPGAIGGASAAGPSSDQQRAFPCRSAWPTQQQPVL